MRQIRDWLKSHVNFKRDPPGREFVQPPLDLLEQVKQRGYAVGDCDCVATFGAAALIVLGVPCAFVVVGFVPGGPFSHVYLVAEPGGAPIVLDTTRPDQIPDDLKPARTMRYAL